MKTWDDAAKLFPVSKLAVSQVYQIMHDSTTSDMFDSNIGICIPDW